MEASGAALSGPKLKMLYEWPQQGEHIAEEALDALRRLQRAWGLSDEQLESVKQRNVCVLGSYMGYDPEEVARLQLRAARTRHERLYSRLERMEGLSKQARWWILRQSAEHFATYVGRTLPPGEARLTMQYYERRAWSIIRKLGGITEQELATDRGRKARRQSFLPLSRSGLGLSRPTQLTEIRFLASLAQAAAEGDIQSVAEHVQTEEKVWGAHLGQHVQAAVETVWQRCGPVAAVSEAEWDAVVPPRDLGEQPFHSLVQFYAERGAGTAHKLERFLKKRYNKRQGQLLIRDMSPVERGRLTELSHECATAFPWHSSMELSDEALRAWMRSRLGLSHYPRGPWVSFDSMEAEAERAVKRHQIQRHNRCLRVIARWCSMAGVAISTEVKGLAPRGDRRRPDILVHESGMLVDLTIVNPLKGSIRGRVTLGNGRELQAAEEQKCRGYQDIAHQHELTTRGMAISVYGRWGPQAEQVLKHLAGLAAEQRSASTLSKWEFLFGLKTALQAALHKGNADLLAAVYRSRVDREIGQRMNATSNG